MIPPPVAFFVALTGMMLLNRVLPGPLVLPWPFNLGGAVFMLSGLVLAVSANVLFMRSGVSPRLFQGGPELVARGPFRLTRNPMYLSLVMTAAGVAMVMGHLSPWVWPIALFFWFDRMFIPREETVLAAHFGAGWDAYRARVRRWI